MSDEAKWALITGASGGLGIELAKELARRGFSLVLTARSAASMETLAEQIRRAFHVKVIVEAVDLATPQGAGMLQKRLLARGVEPEVLVNNAGFGLSAPFLDHDPDRLRAMLQLNIISPTELTQTFGRRMVARGQGHILLVASLAAFQPGPLLAAYSASKAYMLSLGEALNVELAGKVGVTVLSPGLMNTGFNVASGFTAPPSLRRTVLEPAKVARIGLDALFAGKSSIVAGRANKLLAFSSRLISRHVAAKAGMEMAAVSKTAAHG